MPSRRPVITLTTDFGTADPFVASMKGVILDIQPEAVIVDVTHEVAPHDILEAAFHLRCAFPYFPTGSVHVAVVDPGVGSARRAILAVTENHRFIAPDNGVLGLLEEVEEVRSVIHLTASRYFRSSISATFHGRNVFAPAAAWLSRGIDPESMGDRIDDWNRLQLPVPRMTEEGTVTGVVLGIDRFGNVTTAISRALVERLLEQSPGELVLEAEGRRISRQVRAYYEIGREDAAFLFNSSDLLEIAANRRSAAQVLGLKRGDRVVLKSSGPA